jgi:hypothetical protein
MAKAVVAAYVGLLFASNAMGHEGHGVRGHGDTVSHYVFDPMHLPTSSLACITAIVMAALVMSAISRNVFGRVRSAK